MLSKPPILARVANALLLFDKPWVDWLTELWRHVQYCPLYGDGTPEGQVTARPGRLYTRIDGAAGPRFFVKETGTGNTGWVAK